MAIDRGNDRAMEMTYPLVFTLFCSGKGEIRTCLLSVPSVDKAGRGFNIAELLHEEVSRLSIDETTALP